MLHHPVADHHVVQFYTDEDDLFEGAAQFLCAGLKAGQLALLIATPEHAAGVVSRMDSMVDTREAISNRRLRVLDAEATLAMFMVAGMPNVAAFEANVSPVIAELLRDGPFRAFGEMVDVLWRRGESEAALRLEQMWNRLALEHGFALMCGYSMAKFYSEFGQFQRVCREHSHIIEAEGQVAMSMHPHRD